MAAGAGDVRLQLGVTLDLASFRQQLAAASRAAASFSYPINFDKIGIDRQFAALDRQFRRKNYRLEVATNIKAETENAKVLAKALAELGKAGQQVKGVAGRTAAGAEASTVDAAKFQAMVNRATKPALEALYQGMAKAKIPMGEVGGRTVDELKKSIISGIPGLTQDIASGMTKGLEGLRESGRKGAKFVIDSFKDAAGIASPSKVFKQLGQFSAEGLEDGFLEGLRDFKGKAVSEIRKIVALMRMELAMLGGAASSAVAVAGGGVRGAGRGGTQYMSPIGPLPHGSREPWAYNQGAYRYEPYMAQPGQFRGAGIQSMVSRHPFAPMPGVRATTELPSMFGTARPALPAAGMSSAAGMRQAELFAREAAARARSAERSAAVMRESAIASRVSGQIPLGRGGFPQLPSGTGGALALRGVGGGGGRGTGGGGGVFGRGAGFFGDASGSLNLPGQGVIRELGEEFGFAAKQVLLFGTAYKALAFAQNFPAQVAEAVSQLQSFRNTLAAISPTAQEAVASNSLILSLVERYNIPLQSARDGFTKLYASMQPAGFSGEQIRDLFTGVSKAAATFGMSADKVDRVNYAFAQMASKGQVMSEELKGQLGDVLPGAMAIFAQAAGFKGEQAISKFSAALEDGRYKGSAMIELLNNVTIVLNQKFSRGAEGAAKTFQGAMNNMQTTFKSFYETFEPVAAGFLNGVVTPMMEGVKTITDGLNAFFNGTRAQTAGGFALAQELEKLRPSFDGIKKNATDLIAVFGQFAKIALDLSRVLLEIAGNPIAGYLLKIYAIMVPINMALNVMKGLWALNSIQLLLFNARIATGTATLTAFRGMMAATGATAATTAASIRTAGVTLRTFFATTGVGLVVAGISILIEQFFTLEQKLAAVKEKALGAAQAIRGMSATEARAEEQRSVRAMKILEGLGKRAPLYAGSDRVGLTEPEAQLLESMGIPVPKGLGGGRSLPQTSIAGYQQRIESVNLAESRARQNQIKFEEQQQNRDIQFTEIQGGGGDGGPSRASQAAARAAERAALEAQRLQAVERQLSEELRIRRRTLQIDENIAAARADQDDERMAELESDKRILDIGIRRAKIQKDFDAKRIKAAEYQLRLQLLEIDKIEEQKKYEEDLNKIFKERFGITDPVARAAREAREKSFGFGMGAGAFRTDIDLMPGLTGGILGERREELSKELSALLNPVNQLVEAANNVGKAFGEAFKGMVNGSMTAQQALASFFQSVGDYFLDMASRMIAKWIEMQIIGLAKSLLPGGSTIFPNGVSNFSGAFGPSGPVFQPGAFAANGAVWQGGFTPFANGGVVTGPTLGLVGEGRFNEAIVPLPNGKSIPVELGDGAGSNISTNIVINVGNGQAQSSMTGGGASDLGRKMEGAVKQVIVNELRPGGLLSGGRR